MPGQSRDSDLWGSGVLKGEEQTRRGDAGICGDAGWVAKGGPAARGAPITRWSQR